VQKAYIQVFESATRTSSPEPLEREHESASGVRIVVDCTAVVASPSVTFTIEGYDPYSDKWYALLSSGPVIAIGQTILSIFPGANDKPNRMLSAVLPIRWRISAAHLDADPITYSVGGEVHEL
jgi:hypothetical protein